MKKIATITIIILTFFSCTEPLTQFPEAALNNEFMTLDGNSTAFKDILEKHTGKQILIDVWASWCGDCIQGMPKLKALQKQFPQTVFVFLSADRSLESLKRGIQKYQIKGEHYFMPKGMKSAFGKSMSVRWIPRYMVVDSKGDIKLFKAIKADDEKLLDALRN